MTTAAEVDRLGAMIRDIPRSCTCRWRWRKAHQDMPGRRRRYEPRWVRFGTRRGCPCHDRPVPR